MLCVFSFVFAPLREIVCYGELPEKVISLSQAIHDAGGRALLVGGCVRDALMGVQPKDWDLEVYRFDAGAFAGDPGPVWTRQRRRRSFHRL